MSEQPITHKSEQKSMQLTSQVLESINKNGVKCDFSGNSIFNNYNYTGVKMEWKFDWTALKNTGVDGLSGYITVTSAQGYFSATRIDVDFAKTSQTIEKVINGTHTSNYYYIIFEYSLIPHRLPIIENVSYDEMFLPSDINDTILLIGEKKLHVNKTFLSIHFEFFRALFSSNFKEGQMDEIPIQNVSYEDFGLMMSTIYPKTVFPNDTSVEKLLELADRFIIPAIIGFVEYHLIHNSKLSDEKKMWMADAYGMSKLLEKCLLEMSTVAKFKLMSAAPEYKKLSHYAKSRVLDRLSEFL